MKAIFISCGIDQQLMDFCYTGREAVDLVTESYHRGITYAIIFTDFNMPEMDGIASVKLIRAHFDKKMARDRQPAIVGVTGHVEDKFRQEGIQAGMD